MNEASLQIASIIGIILLGVFFVKIVASAIKHHNKPRIYISGKISGLCEMEYTRRFEKAQEYLEQRYPGHRIINPVEINRGFENFAWSFYMRRDIKELVKCEKIYMLTNAFDDSRGAAIEWTIAQQLSMEILYEATPNEKTIKHSINDALYLN
jgi:hypothetical protein